MRNVILIFWVLGGVAAAILGPLLATRLRRSAYWGQGRPASTAAAASMALGVAVVGIGLGLPLAWASWRALQRTPAASSARCGGGSGCCCSWLC